jgi:cell division protein FtsW (lipid II flippase)
MHHHLEFWQGFFVGISLALVLFILAIKLPCENNTEAAMLIGFVLVAALVLSAFAFAMTNEWHRIPY